jgi:hypothetical protein
VNTYDWFGTSGNQFRSKENVWVVERQGQELTSGNKYLGQFVGYSLDNPAPVYAVNQPTSTVVISSGDIQSGDLTIITWPFEVCENLFWCCEEETALTGSTVNNYSLNAKKPIINFTPFAGGTTLTGIDPADFEGDNGPQIFVMKNRGPDTIKLPNEGTASLANNRYALSPGHDRGMLVRTEDQVFMSYDTCLSGNNRWRPIATTVPPYQANDRGGLLWNVPAFFCDDMYWCCVPYEFDSASVQTWHLTSAGHGIVYAVTPHSAGATTISRINPHEFTDERPDPLGAASGNPQFITITVVGNGSLTINDAATQAGASGMIHLPPVYGSFVRLEQWDSIGLYRNPCISGENYSWSTLFCTVHISGSTSGSIEGSGCCPIAGARVYRGADQAHDNPGMFEAIVFTLERYDVSGFWGGSGDSTLQVADGGYYHIGGNVEVSYDFSGHFYGDLRINNGGNIIARERNYHTVFSQQETMINLNTVHFLESGSVVSLEFDHNFVSGVLIKANGDYSPEFWVTYLGSSK